MVLQTIVEPGAIQRRISLSSRIIVLGSCFADNMGQKLIQHGYDALVNPFGTLYNPESICRSVARLGSGLPFAAADCVQLGAGAGLVGSFWHHTKAARPTAEAFLRDANESLARACDFWGKADVMIVTLGTAWCFVNNANGQVVSNCLKRPAAEFTRKRLSVEDCVKNLSAIADAAKGKQIIFTVSPVRHLSDGANGNSLSKATLLLAVEQICAQRPAQCYYFPSFEILLDELRDYRYFAPDMAHPSDVAVDYIWEKFCACALPGEEKAARETAFKEYKRSLHRDFLTKEL